MNYKILVNKEKPISKSFMNNLNLIKIRNYLDEEILIDRKTYYNYGLLKDYLKSIDISIDIDSAFRSIEEQEKISKKYKDCSFKPWHSEHHTGFAIDLVLKCNNIFVTKNKDLLEKKEIFSKIHDVLKEFGFILRYPQNKEKITKCNYEPWHIRYVGKRTANIIFENNFTLEEYNSKYNISGILVVNKPKGITSRDVVDEVGKIFDTKKVGHTGTLDPLASGVLILTINKATKISEDIMSEDKEYIATVKLGIMTDTLDVTGKTLKEKPITKKLDLEKILSSFKKKYMQEVPIYSAVKVKGKKLYQYARNNEEVSLPKKMVTIKEISLINASNHAFTFKTTVSKGTYIRSLIRDMALSVNECMSMQDLIRTREYKYTIADSYTVNDIRNGNYKILKIEEVLNYPIVNIDMNVYSKIKNGVKLDNEYSIKDKVIFKYNNKLVAIYKTSGNKLVSYKSFIDINF